MSFHASRPAAAPPETPNPKREGFARAAAENRADIGATLVRVRITVSGVVQGVGFRPHVYRLAVRHGLVGFVCNTGTGVLIEAEGLPDRVRDLRQALVAEVPAVARIEHVAVVAIPPRRDRTFAVRASRRGVLAEAPIMPDAATCAACLAELFDPENRRFRYPFITCTGCGPRYTILRRGPYDRAGTTMRRFGMCGACRTEYEDPADRRFHAETIACAACGPSLWLADGAGRTLAAADPIAGAAVVLRDGGVVAVKGLGGFHLACRADDERAVARLRAGKHREAKPFAVMAADLEAAAALIEIGSSEAALLAGPEHPIVLAPWRREAAVAPSVAPGVREGGVMLPYTPLHHLLLAAVGAPLVMTSGNRSDEPIASANSEARRRLGKIADRMLLHDRPIHVRADDSVVRAVLAGAARWPLLLRRARGYVPACLPLPAAAPPILGCGADLKSTVCVARDGRAWLSQHIGDLGELHTRQAYGAAVADCERLFAVRPEIVAHDLHPDYASTAYALARRGVHQIGVQHHHAHFAACLAEHGEGGIAVGAIFDGSGYGGDGTVWGGELLVGTIAACARAGHLWPVRLPGGDRAAREPWRMACAWLAAAGEDPPARPDALADAVDARRWAAVTALVRSGVASPWTSSMGRLFDAVAALCGLGADPRYEGHAALMLESCADERETRGYPFPISDTTDGEGVAGLRLDARAAIRAVRRDVADGVPVARVSARFHNAVAEAAVAACARLARRHGTDAVVLSGGVFQNRLLLERAAGLACAAGLRVLVPRRVPPNDGGIAYGQAAVAAARSATAGHGAARNASGE